jgi:xylulose-5-phosphate/fructose-6-phosphate phosphoketolase
MVVLNKTSRFHLCIEALRRAPRMKGRAGDLIERCKDMLEQHRKYVEKNLEDMPQIRDWKWTDV